MYYPKTKIITNLSTDGSELIYIDTELPYIGKYHILSNGSITTGKTPQDGEQRKLKPVDDEEDDDNPRDFSTPANIGSLSETVYDFVRQGKQIKRPPLELIEPQYTQPSGNFPSFTRYFLRRTNNIIFTEVSNRDYTAIITKNRLYNWGIYIPFQLPWTTSGADVEGINKRMVLLTEKKYKVYGFSQYITNYTEFTI
tara:strand:+ start:6971 stop:7561 length:591 start_codon:yes stop_codon:yes gene_type:complete